MEAEELSGMMFEGIEGEGEEDFVLMGEDMEMLMGGEEFADMEEEEDDEVPMHEEL